MITVSASVVTKLGNLNANELFQTFIQPGDAARIAIICWDGSSCNSIGFSAGVRARVAHFLVVDEYNNTVSNVPITINSRDIGDFNKTQGQIPNHAHSLSVKETHPESNNHKHTEDKRVIAQNKDHECNPFAPDYDFGCDEYDNDFGAWDHYDPGDNAGPYTNFNTAKIALKEDCNIQSLMPPICSEEEKNILSNHFYTTFSVYGPTISSETIGTSTRHAIELSSPELITESFNIRVASYISESAAELQHNIYTNVHYGQFQFYGPYGLYHASKPGKSFSINAAIYANETISEGNSYFIDKLPTTGVVQSPYFFWDHFAEVKTDYFDAPISHEITSHNGGELELTVIENDFDKFDFTLPQTTGKIDFSIDFELSWPSIPQFGTILGPTIQVSAYSATVDITNITPTDFMLNDQSRLLEPIGITASIEPPDYKPESATFILYKDGNIEAEVIREYPFKSDLEFSIRNGALIEPLSNYEIEVILNKDSAFEIKSSRTPIEGFSQKIVAKATCENSDGAFSGQACGGRVINNKLSSTLKVQTSIDLLDPLVCKDEGIEVFLNSDATMSIDLERLDAAGDPSGDITNIANGTFTAGANIIPVTAEQLGQWQLQRHHYLKFPDYRRYRSRHRSPAIYLRDQRLTTHWSSSSQRRRPGRWLHDLLQKRHLPGCPRCRP
ncbi:MAG: hypothetical protein JKY19_16500 [Alcanivoracaceae bacterium]|nr:hypothetical protein [Alcanivoracaceae bacterium]